MSTEPWQSVLCAGGFSVFHGLCCTGGAVEVEVYVYAGPVMLVPFWLMSVCLMSYLRTVLMKYDFADSEVYTPILCDRASSCVRVVDESTPIPMRLERLSLNRFRASREPHLSLATYIGSFDNGW